MSAAAALPSGGADDGAAPSAEAAKRYPGQRSTMVKEWRILAVTLCGQGPRI